MSGLDKSQKCIFCLKEEVPFTKIEHIIPESLGGDEILGNGVLCDKCNEYFGREIENEVLNSAPIGFSRAFLGIRNKKRKFSNFKGFKFELSGSESYPFMYLDYELLTKFKNQKEFIVTAPEGDKGKIIRFLLKIGLELLAKSKKYDIYGKEFNKARVAARFPKIGQKWKIAETNVQYEDASEFEEDEKGPLERRLLYNYHLGISNKDKLIFLVFQYWLHLYMVPLTEGDFDYCVEMINATNPEFRKFINKEFKLI